MTQPDLLRHTGARFSDCGRYRYTLRREWRPAGGAIPDPTTGRFLRNAVFLMLNPSTADEFANDPTVERCERYAMSWGYGGLIVVNLFAYRSTDPRVLPDLVDPVGPENDSAILGAAISGDGTVLCAWGNHGGLNGRALTVAEYLVYRGIRLTCLGVNRTGHPVHPLYQPKDLRPRPYDWTLLLRRGA